MNYEKFGICITILIMVGVLGFAGISSGATIGGINLGEPFDNKQIIPEKSSDSKGDGYYEWCYKMGIKDC